MVHALHTNSTCHEYFIAIFAMKTGMSKAYDLSGMGYDLNDQVSTIWCLVLSLCSF